MVTSDALILHPIEPTLHHVIQSTPNRSVESPSNCLQTRKSIRKRSQLRFLKFCILGLWKVEGHTLKSPYLIYVFFLILNPFYGFAASFIMDVHRVHPRDVLDWSVSGIQFASMQMNILCKCLFFLSLRLRSEVSSIRGNKCAVNLLHGSCQFQCIFTRLMMARLMMAWVPCQVDCPDLCVCLCRVDLKKMKTSKSTDNIQFLPFLTTCAKYVLFEAFANQNRSNF